MTGDSPGIYVIFDGAKFRYAMKASRTTPLAEIDHARVLQEILTRSRRPNLGQVYVAVAVISLLISLVSAESFLAVCLLTFVAGYFVLRWDRERRTTRIFYNLDHDEIAGRLALCNLAAETLARSARLWHLSSSTAAGDPKYHAGASHLVTRTPIRCQPGFISGVELNVETWCIPMGPQRLLFLPDALLVHEGSRCYAIGYESLNASHVPTRFIESEGVPRGTQVVGQTWRYVNKSGGPDLRFSANRQIPIVAYSELTLDSGAGRVVIQSSLPAATQIAAAALQDLNRIALEGGAPSPPATVPAASRPAEPAVQRAPQPAAPSTTASPASAGSRRGAYAVHAVAPAGLSPTPPTAAVPVAYVQQPLPQAAPQVLRAPIAPAYSPAPPAATQSRQEAGGAARFLGEHEAVTIGGWLVRSPLTYVSNHPYDGMDASTIVPSLPVGNGARAMPLPYWPRYAHADPDQRARYLDWMAGGRTDPSVDIGYVFIFFYGLERRVLIDGADENVVRKEVTRLLSLYPVSGSFRGYATQFLAFAPLRHAERLATMSWDELMATFHSLAHENATGLQAIAGWCHLHRIPLPAVYAAMIARASDNAKRGAAVTRSPIELFDLFSIRYRETFGDGIVPEAAKRPLTLDYHPANATLLSMRRPLKVVLPDVVAGRPSQFRKLVDLWNACVDDMRKASSKKRAIGTLDAAAWSALPPELRAEYDHPDQDAWDGLVAALPVLGHAHLAQAGQLAALVGIDRSDKLTPAQLRKVATRAAEVGYAIEPDSRAHAKALEWAAEVLIWRSTNAAAPDPKIYGAVHAMLSLTMKVAMADGVFAREEQEVVNAFFAELFALDEDMKTRVEAMKQLMARDPARIGAVAKTLKASRTPAELAKVGTVLVAIAAADGTIAEAEEKALRSLYKSLGLTAGDLTAAMTRTGARLERDAVVEVQSARGGRGGVAIPPPPDATPGLVLDRNAIASIVADTKEVAAILAEVFDDDTEEGGEAPPSLDPTGTPAARSPVAPLPRASEATQRLAQGLDIRYHAVLEELLTQPRWSSADVRRMADRHRLMPGAIIDTINGWSDDALGDFLIEDVGDWNVNRALVKVSQ